MRQNKRTIIGIIFVLVVLIAVLVVSGNRLNTKIAEGNVRLSELEDQISDEEARTEEISEMQEYMQSDEYKEQVAKDKLGLVKDGEIIFKESDND